MRLIRPAAAVAATLILAVAVAACGSGGSKSASAARSGTVTIAWPATPNFIFPLSPATNTDGYNGNLTMLMWPYLVYSGDGARSIVNPQESLFSSITWNSTDTAFTMVLKPWKWSDGKPVTSRDFTFVYNLLKANYANWSGYLQGLFPTDVASVSTPNAHTAVVTLTHAYNPAFYEDYVLSSIPLLPQHAWDVESAGGPVGNYDETTAGAKAVFGYLQKIGGEMGNFASNPMWQVVDGPYRLSQFAPNGTYTYAVNKSYSGNMPHMTKVVNEYYATDVSELDSLRAGGSLDTGNLPLNDLQQANLLKSEGYSVIAQPLGAFASIDLNFYNAKVGPVLQQLYIRQAMEDLINRPQMVSKIYSGDADPGNGPVSLNYTSLVSPLEKSGGPYPYSPSTAVALLKSHGWKVVPNGVSACQQPGTGPSQCGKGITAGEQLSFQLAYSSGDAAMDEQEAAIQSSYEQAGIKIALKSEPFNTLIGTIGTCTASSHPAATCGWDMFDQGYIPYGLYPSGIGNFNTGGLNNQGGYSNPEMDKLINETEYSSNPSVFFQYENYADEQLPQLWLPDSDIIQVYKSDIGGFAPINPFSGGINPEDWYYGS